MIIASSLFFIYAFTMITFTYGVNRVTYFTCKNLPEKTSFTVIVPFRNEAAHLPSLLASIDALAYSTSLVHFILVDDDSEDASCDIIDAFSAHCKHHITVLKNIRTSNSPKKDAITTAIKETDTAWILTIDADCILHKNWLATIDNYIQQHACNMLVAPVTYKTTNSLLDQFQLIEFLSLQAATIGGFGLQQPFLCNGANLGYKKSVFENVHGFDNNNCIASGDDIFLLEKFLMLDKTQVHYVKNTEAIVTTYPVKTVHEALNQRVRWASKTANYTLFFGKCIGAIVGIGNTVIAVIPVLYITNNLSVTSALTLFVSKIFVDFLLITKATAFFKQKISFSSFLISSFLYPYVAIIVTLKSLFSRYQWKGRTFTK